MQHFRKKNRKIFLYFLFILFLCTRKKSSFFLNLCIAFDNSAFRQKCKISENYRSRTRESYSISEHYFVHTKKYQTVFIYPITFYVSTRYQDTARYQEKTSAKDIIKKNSAV